MRVHHLGDVIPPKATLTFLVRLVQINDDWWTEDAEDKKIIAWETEFKPEPCEVMAGYSDNLYIHYRATRSVLSSASFAIFFPTKNIIYFQRGRERVRDAGGRPRSSRADDTLWVRDPSARPGLRLAGDVSRGEEDGEWIVIGQL